MTRNYQILPEAKLKSSKTLLIEYRTKQLNNLNKLQLIEAFKELLSCIIEGDDEELRPLKELVDAMPNAPLAGPKNHLVYHRLENAIKNSNVEAIRSLLADLDSEEVSEDWPGWVADQALRDMSHDLVFHA